MNTLLLICTLIVLILQLLGTFIGSIYLAWFLMLLVALQGLTGSNWKNWLLSVPLLVLLISPLLRDESDTNYAMGVVAAVATSIVYSLLLLWGQQYRRKNYQMYHETLTGLSTDEIAFLIEIEDPLLLNEEETEELADYAKDMEIRKTDYYLVRGITMFCIVCIGIHLYHSRDGLAALLPLAFLPGFGLVLYLNRRYIHTCTKEYNAVYTELIDSARERARYVLECKKYGLSSPWSE